MPILPAEPALYPESLFADGLPGAPEGGEWWVLHTRPRQEKSLVRQLIDLRSACYLPLVRRRVNVAGRNLHSVVPLFPGYVFLHGRREERVAALATRRVVRALPVPDQSGLWHDLAQI